MSLLHANMINNQLNTFNPGHIRSRSYNELLNQFKATVSTSIQNSTDTTSSNGNTKITFIKKRSYSDLSKDTTSSEERSAITTKRSRTAPPYGSFIKSMNQFKSYRSSQSIRCRSLSPNKKYFNSISPSISPNSSPVSSPAKITTRGANDVQAPNKIKLPSISSALNSASITPKAPLKLKPITPTVSLDYLDTYKPNDENWRYELLDTINKGSKHFNLNQYNYLNKHSTSLSSNSAYKPSFDSRISSKITKPTLIPKINHYEKKINFPYESNYTYLNKTYLNDVEKYPEYLELAQSLIQLSQPQSFTQSQPQSYSPTNTTSTAHHISTKNHVSTSPITNHTAPISDHMTSNFYSQPVATSYNNLTSPSLAHLQTLQQNRCSQFTTIISEVPSSSQQSLQRSHPPPPPPQAKFIPITPSSAKSKSRTELLKSPPKHHHNPRVCISCGSDQSPCWRPSWSIKEGQLCNSCGLRYKKTSARCLNDECKKIPAKGEWSLMQSKGKTVFEDGIEGYSCLDCGWRVEVKK